MVRPQEHAVCPFFQDNDDRCAQRFTLERMGEVFELCLGAHRRCIVYHELCVRIERQSRPVLAQAG